MPKVVTLTTDGVSTSKVHPTNLWKTPFSVTVMATVSGTPTYSLQFTLDNPLAVGFSAGSATWQDHPIMSGATTDGTVEFTSPVCGIRINQTSGASPNGVSAKVLQAGL